MTGRLRVVVVRHGETEWARNGRHTGTSDIPLTPLGEAQARALGPVFAAHPFDTVLTSPRSRAHRTCELAGCGAAATIDADLAEWDYGDYEGVTTAEIRRERPGWSVWEDGCPRGESPDAVGARADRLIARLHSMNAPIALFGHGQFGRVLAMRWLGWPVRAGRRLPFDPACYGVLGQEPGDPSITTIDRWNLVPPGLDALD